jgi:ribosome assembly protein SQT1
MVGAVYSVAWSPQQADLVVTGGSDDRAYIWRVGQEAFEQTGGAVLELTGHTDTVSSLLFNADGSSLASGGMDGRVKIWEVASGRCMQTLEGPGDAVEWLTWHPKGNVLLAGAADFTAWMWLAQTGACMQVRDLGSHKCNACVPHLLCAVPGRHELRCCATACHPS